MSRELFVAPIVSEKAYGLSQAHNRFAFKVPADANKHTVARAIEVQYGVEVADVRIVNQAGKRVRAYRNKRFTNGVRSDVKKAYVTLKKGHSLPIFAAVEEEEAPKKTSKKNTEAEIKQSSTKTTVKTAKKAPVGKRIFSRKSGEK